MGDNIKKRKNSSNVIIILLSIVAIIAILVIVIIKVFEPKEKYISSGSAETNIASLYCSSNNPIDPFFIDKKEEMSLHEIKITFKNNMPDQISYTYTGTYVNNEQAATAEATFSGQLGTYMSSHGMSSNILAPHFTDVDNQVYVNINGDSEALNSVTAKIFFMSPEDAANFSQYTEKDFKVFYSEKSFSCKYNK